MSTQEVLKQNWKEFFMAIAVAVVFVFQSLNSMNIKRNNTFIEDLEANRGEIRKKITAGVHLIIDEREKKHIAEHHGK